MIKQLVLMLLLLLLLPFNTYGASSPRFCVAVLPAPVLSSSAFSSIFGGKDGKTLRTDKCGQVRELEFIAFPGTLFRIKSEIPGDNAPIYQVETEEYPTPAGGALYIDSRFVETRSVRPSPRERIAPDRRKVADFLRSAAGKPYVWGGNVNDGIAEMLSFYYSSGIDEPARKRLTLAGLDCSGLLYEATGGWIPRNTSQLVYYGTGIAIKGKSAGEIVRLLKPLDLIVWNGHLLIVLDGENIIESRLECGAPPLHGGVIITPLQRRIEEIMRSRKPENSWPKNGGKYPFFVVRRWIS